MKDNKKHILVIASWYPIDVNDISGSFFREQAIALSKYGYTVGVINPQLHTLRDVKKILQVKLGLNILNDNDVQTIRFNYLNLTPRINSLIKYLWLKLGLYLFEVYLRNFGKPDIIHVHSMRNAGYLALQISKMYNIPYIITEHSSAYEKKLVSKKEFNKLKEVVNSSSYNIAVSKKFCELLNSKFSSKKWHYIPNIVNNDFIEYKIFKREDSFIFLFVGNLNRNKSVDTLLEAFSRIIITAPSVKLRIIGEGPEKLNLFKLAKKLGIDKNVEFLGSLSRHQVKIEMSNASVLVHPSKYETFGVVIIEALAMGLPVIATRCGGPESVVVDTVGILIDPESVSQLSDAMNNIIINYETYNSNDIREYCKGNFSEEAIVSRLTEVYNEITGTG